MRESCSCIDRSGAQWHLAPHRKMESSCNAQVFGQSCLSLQATCPLARFVLLRKEHCSSSTCLQRVQQWATWWRVAAAATWRQKLSSCSFVCRQCCLLVPHVVMAVAVAPCDPALHGCAIDSEPRLCLYNKSAKQLLQPYGHCCFGGAPLLCCCPTDVVTNSVAN